MNAGIDHLAEARQAHQRGDWGASYAAYVRADGVVGLALDDLDAYATAAWRLGQGREAVRLAERVYAQLVRVDSDAAAMKALDIALEWMTRGDVNMANGWMARARRLFPDGSGPIHGYLAYLDAVVAVATHDSDELTRRAAVMRDICAPLDDPLLTSLSLVTQALAAIYEARVADGYAFVDEAILPLLSGEVRIAWVGHMYCVVLHVCHKLADQPRMRSWTDVMARWCDVNYAAPYSRVCDVHRLQLGAADADYGQLEAQLLTASSALEDVNTWVGGAGYYQLGEVRRLRGDSDGAMDAFARVRSFGVDPQPGEALLKCKLGQPEAAWTDLRLALSGAQAMDRMPLLRAAVEVALTRDSLDEAERYCRELADGAATFGTPGFRGWAAHARGALLVRRGDHAAAVSTLEAALREYRHQQWRYEMAEVYEWMALAHRGLGRDDLAAADVATADNVYTRLAVEPSGIGGRHAPGGLTRRELEVLRAIAGGATNRQVAQQISISEKTVGRHLANVYAKLGVSSRTAAVTWAYQNHVLDHDS